MLFIDDPSTLTHYMMMEFKIEQSYMTITMTLSFKHNNKQ